MTDSDLVKSTISAKEGTEKLLYSDPDNPYESIYIRAKVSEGLLTVIDSECEHAPDGGWSHRILSFDSRNTEAVFAFLLEMDHDPYRALAGMLSYNSRTGEFRKKCDARGIEYENKLAF